MSTTFESALVGDRVWDILHGWGVIDDIDTQEDTLRVSFSKNCTVTYYYCRDGRKPFYDNRTLFWDEIKFEAPTQPLRMKLVNGIEVPHISCEPKIYCTYCVPDPTNPEWFRSIFIEDYNNKRNEHAVKHGMYYPFTEKGKQAAILHAKAILGIKDNLDYDSEVEKCKRNNS